MDGKAKGGEGKAFPVVALCGGVKFYHCSVCPCKYFLCFFDGFSVATVSINSVVVFQPRSCCNNFSVSDLYSVLST